MSETSGGDIGGSTSTKPVESRVKDQPIDQKANSTVDVKPAEPVAPVEPLPAVLQKLVDSNSNPIVPTATGEVPAAISNFAQTAKDKANTSIPGVNIDVPVWHPDRSQPVSTPPLPNKDLPPWAREPTKVK